MLESGSWGHSVLQTPALVLLDFGDLDFIFKVMPALGNLNFVRKKFYALCWGYRISVAY